VGSADYYNQDYRVTHVDAAGLVTPGWPVDEGPCSGITEFQRNRMADRDGAGGAFACWLDLQDGDIHVRVQRFLADGTSPSSWPEHGLAVKQASLPGRSMIALGAMAACGRLERRWIHPGDDFGSRSQSRRNLQHVPSAGNRGSRLSASADLWRLGSLCLLTLVADGQDGVYAIWNGSNAQNSTAVSLQHFTAGGTIAAGGPHRTPYAVSGLPQPPGGDGVVDGSGSPDLLA
jgi:hypothetical protein